jgi:hypothetical protein
MKLLVVVPCSLAVLGLTLASRAGTGGANPPPGDGRKVVKTDPPPEESVAHADFKDANGSTPATMHVNPEGGGSSTDWDQAADGQYYLRGGSGVRSFCFYNHPPPAIGPYTTYEYKLHQEPVSSGYLGD